MFGGVEHVVMVVPVDSHKDEAEDVAKKSRQPRLERGEVGAVRHFEFEHHNGDDDREHAIAECFESAFAHLFASLALRSTIASVNQSNSSKKPAARFS